MPRRRPTHGPNRFPQPMCGRAARRRVYNPPSARRPTPRQPPSIRPRQSRSAINQT